MKGNDYKLNKDLVELAVSWCEEIFGREDKVILSVDNLKERPVWAGNTIYAPFDMCRAVMRICKDSGYFCWEYRRGESNHCVKGYLIRKNENWDGSPFHTLIK